MADGTLHPAGCGTEPLGDLRVQHLRYGIDHVHVLHGDDNGLPQVLVALDVGRHADLVDDGGDHALQLRRRLPLLRRRHSPAHMLHQRAFAHRLGQEDICSHAHRLRHHPVVVERRQHDGARPLLPLPELAQHAHAVQHRQHGVQQQDLRMRLLHQCQHLSAVSRLAHDLKLACALQRLPQQQPEIRTGIRQQYANFCLHVSSPVPFLDSHWSLRFMSIQHLSVTRYQN